MLEAAKLIGAGLASFGLAGAAAGAGIIFSALISGVARNPSLRGQLFTLSLLSYALCEALGLFSLTLSFLIMYS